MSFYAGSGLFGDDPPKVPRSTPNATTKRVAVAALAKETTVEQRLAEAESFLDLPCNTIKEIKDSIRDSARDFGELCSLDSPRSCETLPEEVEYPQRLTIKKIQGVVAAHFNMDLELLISQRRYVRVVRPRHIAMYLAKVLTQNSLSEIGRRFGGRDHTTVLHAVRTMEKRLAVEDAAIAEEIAVLKGMLLS